MTTKGNGAGPEGRPGEAPIRIRPSDGRPADMSSSPPPVTGPSGRTGPGSAGSLTRGPAWLTRLEWLMGLAWLRGPERLMGPE